MFRYDEFEASIAFTQEVQNLQIDQYTVTGIDTSEEIINPIFTDNIDINRGMRCFKDPGTD
jgi:hypothetical protein